MYLLSFIITIIIILLYFNCILFLACVELQFVIFLLNDYVRLLCIRTRQLDLVLY